MEPDISRKTESDENYFLLDSKKIHFTQTKTGIINMAIENGEKYNKVSLVRVFPLSMPDHFICVNDSKNEEIGIIENLKDLSHEQQVLIREELRLRYFIPIIQNITEIKKEYGLHRKRGYGLYMWEVDTDWGHKTFFVAGRNENINIIEGYRFIITDVENCRYDIPNYLKLPPKAIAELEKIL